jgi:ribosomal protein L31
MKNNIHPQYADTSIRCACGNEIELKFVQNAIRFLPVNRNWWTLPDA